MDLSSPWVKSSEFLKRLTDDSSLKVYKYSKGSIIVQQAQNADFLYYLLEGRAKVSLLSESGEEKTLAIHEPGSFIGETPFFSGCPYIASTYTLLDSKLIKISRADFERLMQQIPEIALSVLQSMGRKVRLLTFQVEYLSFFDIKTQLAVILLSLIQDFGYKDDKGYTHLSVSITDQELGNLVGVRREAITKVMSKFRQLGILDKKQRSITFMRPELLHQIVDEVANK